MYEIAGIILMFLGAYLLITSLFWDGEDEEFDDVFYGGAATAEKAISRHAAPKNQREKMVGSRKSRKANS